MQMFTSDQPVNVLLLICIHAPTSSPDGAPIRSVLSVSAWPLRRSFVADYALFPAAGVINMSWMGRAKRKLLYIYWSCFSPGLAEPGRVGSQISHRRIQWFVLILTFSVNVHYVGFLFLFFFIFRTFVSKKVAQTTEAQNALWVHFKPTSSLLHCHAYSGAVRSRRSHLKFGFD